MTDEELESMEIDWTQGVAENFERVKSAALAALEAANRRADEAEARRKCYECGSEMTACAECNPELWTAERDALKARVEENEKLRILAASTVTYLRDLHENIVRNDADMSMDECESPEDFANTIDAALKENTNAQG